MPTFNKWVPYQVTSNFPKVCEDMYNKLRAQNRQSGISPSEKPTCAKCRKGHFGDCLVEIGNSFSCGKIGHKVWD